jgi:peptidoglycan/LPS O-acetylase OafA/YrhL
MFRRIYILFGITIAGVVLSHADVYGLWALYSWTGRYQDLLPANFDPFSTPQWFILIFLKHFFVFCVPVFYFISGYLFTYAIDKSIHNVKWIVIKNRILGLLVPYLIWVIISIIFRAGMGQFLSLGGYFGFLFGVNGGYWFITNLFIYFLLSRWIISLAHDHWKPLLFFTGIFQLSLIVLKYTHFFIFQDPTFRSILSDNFETLSVYFIFYYVLGITVGMHFTEIQQWLARKKIILAIFGGIILVGGLILSGWTDAYIAPTSDLVQVTRLIISQVYSLLVILIYCAYDNLKIPYSKTFIKLSSYAYGIFLIHFLFMEFFSKVVYHFFPRLLSSQLIFTLINILIGFGVPLLIMNITKRSPLKKFYPLLFG